MRPLLIPVVTLAVMAGLCGCASDTPTFTQPLPSAGATSGTLTTPPSPTATSAPEPSSTASELAKFDALSRAVIARHSSANGREFIDALIAAGYAKSTLQVTPDRTSIGLPAPSIQFSALLGSVCLIGQYGPDSGGYHGIVAEPIGTHCLIGTTRAITW